MDKMHGCSSAQLIHLNVTTLSYLTVRVRMYLLASLVGSPQASSAWPIIFADCFDLVHVALRVTKSIQVLFLRMVVWYLYR